MSLRHHHTTLSTLASILLFVQPGSAQAGTVRLPRHSPAPSGEFEALSTRLQPAGYIALHVPEEITPEKAFNLDVELVPTTPRAPQTARVYLGPTRRVVYEPSSAVVTSGNRTTIEVVVHQTGSGLTEISAAAEGWSPLRMTVNTGFRGKLRPSLGKSLQGGRTHAFTLGIVDSLDKPMQVDAPVTVTLSVNGAWLRSESTTPVWRRKIILLIEQGLSTSELVEIKPASRTGSTAHLMTVLKINDDAVLSDQVFEIAILPAWWVPLALAILGGLLGGLYVTVRKFAKTRRAFGPFTWRVAVPTIASGLAAGVLAYLSASFNVVGIQVDPAALEGYVFLGVFFAYVGVDTVLEGLRQDGTKGQQPKKT